MGSVTRYLPIFSETGHGGGGERREESTVSSMPSNFLFQRKVFSRRKFDKVFFRGERFRVSFRLIF